MNMKRLLMLSLLLLVPSLVGFWAGYSIGNNTSATAPPSSQSAVYQEAQSKSSSRDSLSAEVSSQRSNAITRVVAEVSPAVVGINVTEVREFRDRLSQLDPVYRYFFGDRMVQQEIKELGSGFIISPDGYILTNDHVAGNAREITVTMTDGSQFTATLVGTDQVTDIALLKIDGKNLPYVRLGNSDDVIIAEWVIALGNPFGLFEVSDKPTVTVGVVSATGMNLQADQGRFYRGMIQTDASINSGNSGGPLINTAGEVIGVNSVIYTPNQGSVGVGFAIPINRVKAIFEELKEKGKIDRNFWTGLDVQVVDQRVARYFKLDKVEGVIVSNVRPNSPAGRSGFQVGDIITTVNGERIASEGDILSIILDARIGDSLDVKILREKKPLTLSLKIEKRPS